MADRILARVRAMTRAFTLVEMLVVLAIIGVLSGLILPALSRARESGRQTSCMNNLRQLGMAFQTYTKTFDEYLPPYMIGGRPWIRTFMQREYIVGESMICPSNNNPLRAKFARNTPMADDDYWYPDYGMNWLWLGSSNGVHAGLEPFEVEATPATLARIRAPGETILASEAYYSDTEPEKGSCLLTSYWLPMPGAQSFLDPRHGGAMVNVLWVDGHVKAEQTNGSGKKPLTSANNPYASAPFALGDFEFGGTLMAPQVRSIHNGVEGNFWDRR
jgi:prepilin-type N-terminal cleavage/methylation domain-containing protein/prepilin-type processing-associated H-X9-DG protein